jgi:pyruvate kinase
MYTTNSHGTQLPLLIHELEDLHSEMLTLANDNLPVVLQIHKDNQASAGNLLHYLALRRHDLREIQEQLAALGLSSLGRTEAHALSAVRNVVDVLTRLNRVNPAAVPAAEKPSQNGDGRRLLGRNAELLLGPAPENRKVRIMVTMSSEAATRYELIRDLVASGMNCMRINCAHDGPEAWSGMIRNLRQAEQETGKRCKVEMDVAGPKLRTGPIESNPAVIKWRPQRDAFGFLEVPARIWLTPATHPEIPPHTAAACLPVSERWLSNLAPGDEIQLTDARGKKRSMKISETAGKSRWAECGRTAYVVPGTVLGVKRNGRVLRTRIGTLPAKPQSLVLKPGDTLNLTRSLEPGRSARLGPAGVDGKREVESPARIGVLLPEFFDCVHPGEAIWLDDGKIGGIISKVRADEVEVKITQAPPSGAKLGAEKGINIPDSNLKVASLTASDLENLEFIAKHADLLGYSFVRTEEDVRDLEARLDQLGATDLGIVLKIETRQGFENLPRLLLEAMRRRTVGVMIARGDLAIECGFQRLAEMQEEILWISEAAHVPVIWATQVLESMAKSGVPSRSEITDAAMGERAECVMLNKGPYVGEAVKALDDILHRMQAHHEKKSSMLRKLHVAAGFSGGPADAHRNCA